ncbi:hypothetical protein CEE37_08345 [candidate division LCP-89 bacterium B3_LCP]|uniref:histidine kinase n=1 Tax=candidate division LCP-89 bacterium B3_LCP TaxID=2012998 RepID=A0A532UZF1_UNCL8|nr:MAG: hypothetical protein CEE37_08345 [candidate division LCP-89 bacterium B3_LCP]
MTKTEKERILWQGLVREIAHSMGTPLSALMGWIELLPSTGDRTQIFREMNNNLDRLAVISNKLSQIGLPTKFEDIFIGEVCNEVIDKMKLLLPQNSDEIVLRVEINTDSKVRIVKDLFCWALEHLVKNSLNSLKNSSGEVIVSVVKEDGRPVVEIADTGVGIPDENQGSIFIPGVTTRASGRGIGLPLAKYIIEDVHQGQLILKKSIVGEGTTMQLVLNSAETL